MPYRNKQMLRDANGDLIPQYWDVAAGDFKPLTGSGGANDTRLTGSNVEKLISTARTLSPGQVYVLDEFDNEEFNAEAVMYGFVTVNADRSFDVSIESSSNGDFGEFDTYQSFRESSTGNSKPIEGLILDVRSGLNTAGRRTVTTKKIPVMGRFVRITIENTGTSNLFLYRQYRKIFK